MLNDNCVLIFKVSLGETLYHFGCLFNMYINKNGLHSILGYKIIIGPIRDGLP